MARHPINMTKKSLGALVFVILMDLFHCYVICLTHLINYIVKYVWMIIDCYLLVLSRKTWFKKKTLA